MKDSKMCLTIVTCCIASMIVPYLFFVLSTKDLGALIFFILLCVALVLCLVGTIIEWGNPKKLNENQLVKYLSRKTLKWLWIPMVLCGGIIGLIVYFIIRHSTLKQLAIQAEQQSDSEQQ